MHMEKAVRRAAGGSRGEKVSWKSRSSAMPLTNCSGLLREMFPVFRKSRHRVPVFFIALYLEVIDNVGRPITELSMWSSQPFGIDMKKYLMQRFEDPDIAPVEMCIVLAALIAISEIYFLGIYHISRRGEYPMNLPYRRPPISEFHKWTQRLSDLHHGWDIIETLMCSFLAMFSPPGNSSAVPAIYRFFDAFKPAIEVLRVLQLYFFY